jgi:hypothetical protein
MQQQSPRRLVTQFRGLYAMSATASAQGSQAKTTKTRTPAVTGRPRKRAS